ncbi:hypothetical protein EP54_09675 [Staphylococcus aureus]|nr:hypothetical protein EP54_09675 [Staphylococcus aureus]ETO55006.1 hypothetical protein Y002_08160 [Staphylococcus aureus MUM270]
MQNIVFMLSTAQVFMPLKVVALKRYRGVIKTLTVNGILLKDKRHSRFGTLQLTQDARHSSSIFHRGG